ncbi:MAG: ROK family protein [Acidobacteria bacterium]|jgi:glucokinase|nr:MAG: ROK family protein [Acidobacteriota bacterium]GIU82385.1 MAG: sugar kinase [Pyrinomonadaceae bacterium]
MKVVLACDLGGTNLRMALVDKDGKMFYQSRSETPKTREEIIRKIVSLAEECSYEARRVGYEVNALGIAAPATLNSEKGIIMKAPNVPALDGMPICSVLENELKIQCFLENDANAAAIGEQNFGSARGFNSIVMVTLGTGVGGGIILDGKLWRGIDGTAGEIGHITVEPMGASCGCGSRGCLEQYSSASAIIRMTKEFRCDYPRSPLYSRLFLTAKDVYEAGKQGDKLALKVFEQMGTYLGIGLAGLINVLNPEAIVIGGGASEGWELFIPYTIEQIRKRAYEEPAQRAKLLKAELGEMAGVLGAAKIAFDKMKSVATPGI